MLNVGLIFDIVIGVLFIFFIYRGTKRGFSGEVIGLVGLFVSSFCAWKFLDPAVDLFSRYVNTPELDENVVSLICAVVIFFAVEIVFAIIGVILTYVVRVTKLSLMDHFMGLLVGIIKTCCIVLLVYAIISTFSHLLPSDWLESSYVMKGASYVWPPIRDLLQAHGILDFSKLTSGI